MAPAKRPGKAKSVSFSQDRTNPPAPFRKPAEVLEPFIAGLKKKHVYITHVDSKPVSFKRKIFLVPVAMNLAVAAAFVWRMYSILPWYWTLTVSALARPANATFKTEDATWNELYWEIAKRAAVFLFDFLLFIFVWPWPVEFTLASEHGNPTWWRWNIGFREKEIYVRRSREWDTLLGDFLKEGDGKKLLTPIIRQATAPLVQEQKTGYLLMNGQWDLDWAAMVKAHQLVDKKDIALDAFKNVVLIYHDDYGWLTYDIKASNSAEEDLKRRQVFAFRDALAALGKENLFYRWVETVQFETSQPGGFGPERQEAVAKKIRDLFEAGGVDFDAVWKEANGSDGAPSL
ncbi:hypothetical protein HJFPF1_12877 [Paramyrothecium foliicola]|nr:hypothetical protein HJFPF1_12877 [Paramyrothecium foliicola]